MNNLSFFKTILVLLAGLIPLAGCNSPEQEEKPQVGTATVAIQVDPMLSVDTTSAVVKFIPSENTQEFRYAIGLPEELESFRNGTFASCVKVTGNEAVEVTFDNLEPISAYMVFAVAKDSDGHEGSIATSKIVTDPDDFSVESTFLLSRSATFCVRLSSNYSSAVYYFGKDGDINSFIAGELETESFSGSKQYLNYFELEPDTDYSFIVQIIDRYGITAKIVEIPVHTPALGEVPYTELDYENNVYTGTYTVSQKAGCNKVVAYICEEGYHDNLINNSLNWAGDLARMLDTWKDAESVSNIYQAAGTEDVVFTYRTPSLLCDYRMEILVLLYDMNGEIVGVDRFRFATPEQDASAPAPTATIEVNNITATGATYTYTMGDGTFACMYDTVDADWFDKLVESEEYSQYYLHNLLFSQGYYFHYNDGTDSGRTWTFEETQGKAGYRYYAVACPMNCNGTQGWGDLVMVEFTTLSE